MLVTVMGLWREQWVGKIDQAVLFAFLTRALQACFGLINLVFITRFFSPELQGYYYTFLSLLALQAFVELGLYLVIISLASHEWSRLSLEATGDVVGDPASRSRLGNLVLFVIQWYSAISILFVLGAGIAGYSFLSRSGATEVNWVAPWSVVIVLAALQLWLTPLLSVLEGCNQVVPIHRFRFKQVIIEGLTAWLLFLSGAGLWVMVGVLASKMMALLYFLVRIYGRFFRSLVSSAGLERISWKNNIWPMQWRLAVQGIVNYFANALFIPVMFHYHGSVTAGQMGMTLQIVSTIHVLSIVWVQTKAPLFGMLIAGQDYGQLDRVWMRSSRLAFTQSLVGSVAFMIVVLLVNAYNPALALRILDPLTVGVLLIAYLALQIPHYQSFYLRAHAREPYLVLGTVGAIAIGLGVFIFGSTYGPIGAALSLLTIVSLFTVPLASYILISKRAEWQRSS